MYRTQVEEYISELRRHLSDLHLVLSKTERVIDFRCVVLNSGEKPANDALVVFEATSDLSLEKDSEVAAKPKHPKPPHFGPGPFTGNAPLRGAQPRRAAGRSGSLPTPVDERRALVFLEGAEPQLIRGRYGVLPAKGQKVSGSILVVLPEPGDGLQKTGGGQVSVKVHGDDFTEASARMVVRYRYIGGDTFAHLQEIEASIRAEFGYQGA